MLRSIPKQEIALRPIEIKESTNKIIVKSYSGKCDFSSDAQMFGITKSPNYKTMITWIALPRPKYVNLFSYIVDHALQHRRVVEFLKLIFARIKEFFKQKSFTQ